MKQPGSTPSARTLIALIAALALALPGIAIAQDPSADQYTPTAPSAGGDVPTSPPPVPNSDGGNGGPAPVDTGSGDGSTDAAAPVDTTDEPTEAETTPTETSGGSGDGEKPESKDDRALDGLAATASVQRQASSSNDDSPATQLLRSESAGGLGMGPFLWAVLGVTALWAIAGVVRRRNDQDGHGA